MHTPHTPTHTPGPWHVGNGPIAYAADGFAVANAVVFHCRHGGSDEAAANARLIAAAPELLVLVQRIALLTDEGDDQIKGAAYIDKSGTIRAKGSMLETIEQARAAIARATELPY